jgi:hypothetical protein
MSCAYDSSPMESQKGDVEFQDLAADSEQHIGAGYPSRGRTGMINIKSIWRVSHWTPQPLTTNSNLNTVTPDDQPKVGSSCPQFFCCIFRQGSMLVDRIRERHCWSRSWHGSIILVTKYREPSRLFGKNTCFFCKVWFKCLIVGNLQVFTVPLDARGPIFYRFNVVLILCHNLVILF